MSKVLYKDKTTTIILCKDIVTKISSTSVENEVKAQSLAANLGIAPKIYSFRGHTIEMEYIDGHELDQFIKLSGIDRSKLKSNIRRIINLMYENGIKHNDLTGKNIMITKNDEIKIIDYGHAVLLGYPVPKKDRDYGVLKNF